MNKATWYQFEITPLRVVLLIIALSTFANDFHEGWYLLPVAALSFYTYSPNQNLRRPRPRFIPYITTSALVFLAIALGVWASEFPQHWYLVPFVVLYFFGKGNEAERLLEEERLRYAESRNPEAVKKDKSHRDNNERPTVVGGIIATTFGTVITFMSFHHYIISDRSWDGDWTSVVVTLVFGVAPLYMGMRLIIRHFIDQPISAIMGDAEDEQGEQTELLPVPAAGVLVPSPDLSGTEPTGFQFKEIDSLPPPPARVGRLGANRNCLGCEPVRMLFLWNFQRTSFFEYKTALGFEYWQQIGPVYLLSDASGLPISRFLKFWISGNLKKAFIHSTAMIETVLRRIDDRPRNHLFDWPGYKRHAFPLHHLVCVYGTWQSAIISLCDHVDVVVLDARSFNSERIGLTWEIGYLVDRVSTNRFVVLTDPTTVLDDLRQTFSVAWRNMAENSPNQQCSEAIRVLHGVDAMYYESRLRVPTDYFRYEASQVAQLFPATSAHREQ